MLIYPGAAVLRGTLFFSELLMYNRWGFVGLVAVIAAAMIAIQASRDADRLYLGGDSVYYAYTAISLADDGDFATGNQLLADKPLKDHEGFFAVSPAGVVMPKHSTLLPVLSVPFYTLLGVAGFVVINGLIVVALVTGVSVLGGDTPAARITAVIVFITGSWLGYSYNYSPDLLLAALIVWSYAMARRRHWFLMGLFAGLAVWAKVYAALILLPLGLVVVPAGLRSSILTVLSSLIGIVPMLILNAVLYGGPFVTGYDRDARVDGDGFRLTEHYSRFHQPLGQGLQNVLFDNQAGMIRTSAVWFLWPLGLALCWRDRFAWCLALGGMINVVFFAFYDEWNASSGGNRFLFPAVALGAGLLAAVTEECVRRFRK